MFHVTLPQDLHIIYQSLGINPYDPQQTTTTHQVLMALNDLLLFPQTSIHAYDRSLLNSWATALPDTFYYRDVILQLPAWQELMPLDQPLLQDLQNLLNTEVSIPETNEGIRIAPFQTLIQETTPLEAPLQYTKDLTLLPQLIEIHQTLLSARYPLHGHLLELSQQIQFLQANPLELETAVKRFGYPDYLPPEFDFFVAMLVAAGSYSAVKPLLDRLTLWQWTEWVEWVQPARLVMQTLNYCLPEDNFNLSRHSSWADVSATDASGSEPASPRHSLAPVQRLSQESFTSESSTGSHQDTFPDRRPDNFSDAESMRSMDSSMVSRGFLRPPKPLKKVDSRPIPQPQTQQPPGAPLPWTVENIETVIKKLQEWKTQSLLPSTTSVEEKAQCIITRLAEIGITSNLTAVQCQEKAKTITNQGIDGPARFTLHTLIQDWNSNKREIGDLIALLLSEKTKPNESLIRSQTLLEYLTQQGYAKAVITACVSWMTVGPDINFYINHEIKNETALHSAVGQYRGSTLEEHKNAAIQIAQCLLASGADLKRPVHNRVLGLVYDQEDAMYTLFQNFQSRGIPMLTSTNPTPRPSTPCLDAIAASRQPDLDNSTEYV